MFLEDGKTLFNKKKCRFEFVQFEDAIRNAKLIGGDSDSIVAIAGSVEGTYYGILEEIYNIVKRFLMIECLDLFVDLLNVVRKK